MNQAKGLYPILLVIVAIAVGYFFTYPQWTGLSTNRDALAAAQEQNTKLKESEAQLNNYLNQYRNGSDHKAQAEKVLPLHKLEVGSILANFDKFATDTGISIASVAFTDVSQSTGNKLAEYQVGYVEMNISASGNYPSFRAFLMQMENSLRIIDVHSLNIQAGNGESDNLDYRMISRVYYQK